MNKKGFTLVELLGTITILGILMTISIVTYSRYIDSSKQKSYDILAESATNAMEEYLMDYPTADSVTLQELYDGEYLEMPKDPSDGNQLCNGKVVVNTKKGNNGSLDVNDYKVSLCCINYNYTYENGEDKYKDKYCKAYPYDITEIKDIKVLNVFSNKSYATYVRDWMNEYGKGIIQVTPIFIDDFNANPEYFLGTNGNWNYDEVVFGFADCYSNKDLSASAASAMSNYLSNGGAAVFGHDTITKGCGNHKNFISLQDYVKIEATTDLAWTGQTKLTIRKKGVFTEYPYPIGDVGTPLTIAKSHVYGQVAKGDVWITFDDIGTPAKSIYLSTYGNNAFIQTGHTNGSATADEKKILANIIFYMVAKQYVTE